METTTNPEENMGDYIVFVRHGEHVTIDTRTSSYDHARRIAKKCGGTVMHADNFHAAYKRDMLGALTVGKR